MAGSIHRDQETAYHHYCYCIVGGDARSALAGLGSIVGGEPPYALRVGELQAIVSRVPVAEYGEERLRANLQRMDWVQSAVLSHEQVVEGCLHQTVVIPMKFCTLFRSESGLIAAFAERQQELLSKLLDLRGRQEWGLRLTADRDRLRQHLLDNDPELTGLRNGVASKSAGAAYLLKKRLEDRLLRSMEQSRADAAEEAFNRLAAVATGATLLKALGSASADGEPVLNAAFLVTEDQLGQLLRQAEQIVSGNPWLVGEPSGPWPPYNFV